MELYDPVTSPDYMPPVLDISGHFITANQFRLKTTIQKKRFRTTSQKIAARENERVAKNMDAARILDEINRNDPAVRGYFNAPKVPSFQILKRSYDNLAFHFRDEKN